MRRPPFDTRAIGLMDDLLLPIVDVLPLVTFMSSSTSFVLVFDVRFSLGAIRLLRILVGLRLFISSIFGWSVSMVAVVTKQN